MYLETLRLINFKNYRNIEFNFNEEINCLVGENGVGKTNVLDAIYYLSLAKSSFNISDNQIIRHGESNFSILGKFLKDENLFEVKCKSALNNKKSISINDEVYERIKDHIGLFPVVLISPNDTDIIRGISENRRKFVDGVIAQIDKDYLNNLLRYNHTLKQRNALLKHTENISQLDYDLIESFDQSLLDTGKKIHALRRKFIDRFLPVLQRLYSDISDHKEIIGIRYCSDMEDADLEKLLKENLYKDILLNRTSTGIHRDDYLIKIDGYPMKKFASQGQQKSLIVSLKIAQFEIMREESGFKPILLMDDVFDKLDDQRIEKIMNLVAGHTFGQIFVTDARPERTLSVFESIDSGIKIFQIHEDKAQLLSS
jgi:DNA replication and repair protein RecF